MSKEVEKFFSSKPKKTILEDNPKSIDDYDREMLQQFCWDAESGIEDDEIDETVKLFMEWRNRRAKAYADEAVNKMTDKEIDKIIQDGKWGYPNDKAGEFMVKELKAFAKEILEHLKQIGK